jgi:shikimate dehydrogenase
MPTFGLIGKNLGHSWSKAYFEEKFIRENLADSVYRNFPLETLSGFRGLIVHNGSIAGLNITVPYKVEIIHYLDRLDPDAAAIGAVNCVKISRRWDRILLKGYNTDMMAFKETLRPLLNKSCRRALVLGSGGAARAVCHALKDLEFDFTIVSRVSRSGSLIYEDLNKEIITRHEIIINATPLGMFPDTDSCPHIPYEAIGKNHLLYDLVYNPEETLFLRKGRISGARTKNGLEMLHLQAEMSWKIWSSSKFKVQSSKF